MSWSCPRCGLSNPEGAHTCSYATVDMICGGTRPPDPIPTCTCGRKASNPCKPCLALSQSDAFERTRDKPRWGKGLDPYEFAMEREKAEEH